VELVICHRTNLKFIIAIDFMKSAQLLISKKDHLSPESLKAFLDEFIAWKKLFIKKTYTDDYLIGAIYKENIFFTKESEYTQLCKCQVELASRCLADIQNEVNGDTTKCLAFRNHILDYLFDLKPYVEQVMKESGPSYVFIEGWKSTTQSSVMMYQEARNLFWSSMVDKSNPVSHRSAVNLSVFALRQALEIRFRRAIGITKIIDEKINDARLRHDFILDFISDNLDLIEIKVGSMPNLINIYKWTNFSIHTGGMPKIWEIQNAFDYCIKAFQPDSPSKQTGWNIHSSVKIKDYAELKKRFETEVNTEFPNKKFHFLYDKKPEAVIA
jgi:hypothetical protein